MSATLEASIYRRLRWGRKALETLVSDIASADRGELYRATFVSSVKAGSYNAAGCLDETEAHDAIVAAAVAAGMKPAKAERQFRAGVRRGLRCPVGPAKRDLEAMSAAEFRALARVWRQAVAASDEAPSAKLILNAIGLECEQHGRFETSQSQRQVAELAGVSVGTVSKYIPLLGKWLDISVGNNGPGNATTWRLRAVDAPQGGAEAVLDVDPTPDLFHRRKRFWLAFSVLSEDEAEPTSLDDMAKAAGVKLRTAKRYVADGVAAGIMLVVAGGVIAVAGAVQSLSTVKADERRARHAADREGWRGWLEAVADKFTVPLDVAADLARKRYARWLARRKAKATASELRRRADSHGAAEPTLRPVGADQFGPSVGLDPDGRAR